MAERRTGVLGPDMEVVRSASSDEDGSRTIPSLAENAVRLRVYPRPRAREWFMMAEGEMVDVDVV
jgi:hypothetical protein